MKIYLKEKETNTFLEKIYIFMHLLKFGIIVNLKSGHIKYAPYKTNCKCETLNLLRHGKTIAVEKNQFMSNTSENSVLAFDAIKDIRSVAEQVIQIHPDIVLLSPLNRTIETFSILQSQISNKLPMEYCSYMIGINNSVWEGKNLEMFDEDNLYVFLQRECSHNIFAKSSNGDSWGDVLIRCAKLIKEINQKHTKKKILLISQGSIYQGLKILLHQNQQPWDGYSANKMFSLKKYNDEQLGYGKLFNLI